MLGLILERNEALGRRAGLEQALRKALQAGQLRVGVTLPSTRSLATELGFARATVVAVYEQLTAEGYLVSRQGAATTVAAITGAGEARRPTIAPTQTWMLDFLPGEPDHSSFPRAAWLAASRRAMERSPDDLFAYGDAAGLPALRAALGDYLGRTRAVVAHPDAISIFNGMAAAIGLLAEALRRGGVTRVAVEDPSLPPLRRIISEVGLEIVSIPVDEEGMSIDALETSAVGAVMVTPAHQYPLGVSLSPARRAALIDWSRRRSAWIIEDDYDGEFRYDRQPVGSLQGLDPERVVYAGTASKSLAAGLRMAWLVLPSGLFDPVARAKGRRGGVSNLEQATLADFIASGQLDRHVRAMKSVYRRRRDALIEAFAQDAPWIRPTGIAGGLHFTGFLSQGGPSEREVLRAASERSIALFGLENHRLARPQPEGLVIGYSRSPAHGFSRASENFRSFLSSFG